MTSDSRQMFSESSLLSSDIRHGGCICWCVELFTKGSVSLSLLLIENLVR